MKASPQDPTQAMYPFSNWSERTTFWNALLNRYPMVLIFWVAEAFPILDLAFIFGKAPNSHYLDLRTRLKGALRVRAIFGLELVFRTFANVHPMTVDSRDRNASFWKYRSWVSAHIPPLLIPTDFNRSVQKFTLLSTTRILSVKKIW